MDTTMRKLARLSILALFPLGCFAAPVAAQAPIDFQPLDPQRGVQDCADADTAAVAPAVCRLRRGFSMAELRERLAAVDPVREGDEITWVAEIDADSVELSGGVQVPMARVRRDGSVQQIPSTDLVPGDAVLLEAGDVVPADARIVSAASLESQEAALTGESAPVA